MKPGQIGSSPFQLVYQNRNKEPTPVTNRFPKDTDHGWSRLCIGRFTVAPVLLSILRVGTRFRPACRLRASKNTDGRITDNFAEDKVEFIS
jgi:hypothetical protein